MAVFVRWEWKKRSKTFLVVFHFFDDASVHNIRFRSKVVNTFFINYILLEDPSNNPDVSPQSIMTWAPSHVEIALLGDVLRYANIIDGLTLLEKMELRKKLEIQVREGPWQDISDLMSLHEYDFNGLVQDAPTTTMIALEGDSDWFFCSKLCQEYIDYLRLAIEPYQKR
jgi:hypothetical protein